MSTGIEGLTLERPQQHVTEDAVESTSTHESGATPAGSPSSRPSTRSQPSRAAKRRLPTEAPEPKKPAPPKRAKTTSRQASATVEIGEAESVSAPPATPVGPSAPPADAVVPPQPASRITFLEVSTAADAQGDRRISRSRAVFPVPVPNLTKKSRGRRVPTTESIDASTVQPEKRVYVCKVDGCGKCFHRGEHLKRHIRSIHTHEKPFKCTYPQCEKFFNRHDNLLQHLKVHKETKASRSQKANSNASEPGTPTPPSQPESQMRDASPPSEAPDSPNIPRPRTIYDQQPNLYAGYVNAGPFESPAESMRFVTNMAVSSLRTEIPQSPTESRATMFPWHHPELMKDQHQLTY